MSSAAAARVLLPKDYLRLRLTGEYVSDMSDAAGTLWLDVARRAWSAEMLAATEPRRARHAAPGRGLRGQRHAARRGRCGVGDAARHASIAGGAGDNAAGAVGIGVIRPGDAFLSLGTSGVYFVAGDRFAPAPEGARARLLPLPARHLAPDVGDPQRGELRDLGRRAHRCGERGRAAGGGRSSRPRFAPSSSCPISPASARRTTIRTRTGVFVGLTHATTRADLGRAVLEGVAFALADGQDALRASGTRIERVAVIGGGARSRFWGRILAAALDRPLLYHRDGELGPAFGAARLARLAVTGESPAVVCTAPPVESVVEPDAALRDRYAARLEVYRGLYASLKDRFRALS